MLWRLHPAKPTNFKIEQAKPFTIIPGVSVV